MYFTGSHSGGAKTYDRAMAVIKKQYSNVPLAGCSGLGMANKYDYGLKGAGMMLLTGITAKSTIVKRFRIGNWIKTKNVVRNCKKTVQTENKRNSNTTHIFFPPGVGFPKFMANLLNHRIEGINPFMAFNNRIWRRFPILSKIVGKPTELLMNIAGIGFSYSSSWPLFTQLHKRGIHFTGSFGADPITMLKTYQFHNYKAYKDSLAYMSISSPELQFESKADSGAEIIPDKRFSLDSFISGGFVPRIHGKWGADALLELYGLEKYPDILERCTQKAFYAHPYRPLCVIDDQQNLNLYGLIVNPNLKHALLTAPPQIAMKLRSNDPKRYKAFIGDQSAATIEYSLNKTLKTLVTKDTAFGLFFDCANRTMVLGDKFGQYLDNFKNHLGEIPYLVILSGGEVNSQNYPIVNFTTVSHIANKTTPVH
ncbi:MAG: FIST N-terminal domain-containing protein [Candidatus Hodarchaeota archaeon]